MKLKKLNLATKILFHVTLVVYGILVTAWPILYANSAIINSFLNITTSVGSGGGSGNTYFDTKFESMEEVKNASLDIIEETMAEGAVLLKNENDALPLAVNDKVSLYGLASYYSVHTGQGSSGVEDSALDDRVTFYDGLTNAGLDVNKNLNDWYGRQPLSTNMGSADFMGALSQQAQYVVKDIAWDSLPADKSNNARAAVMVLARTSGEARDLYMDTTMDDGKTNVVINKSSKNATGLGVDALELTANEKSVLKGLKALKASGTIDSIIVIMNSASALQCEFVDDAAYGIDACLWVGTIGTNGANAIGKLLTGEYNPSGRLSDTFWANSKYNPVYYNFGQIEYGNSSALKNYYAAYDNQYHNKYYVVYQEGIYNGYKYTETRYEDVVTDREGAGNFDYEKVVSYPFGYGLSYTDYTYSNMKVSEGNGTYTITVDVKNNTAVAGKEVVQIYLQKPYTERDINNGVEKASVELVGFDKVFVEGNGTATAKITVDEKYFAAYDSYVERTYVIGSDNQKDKYLLTAAKDAHDAVNNILQYKKNNGTAVDTGSIVSYNGSNGDGDLVWGKYIAYDAVKYSTNDVIKEANSGFEAYYDGQQANWGISEITNQFDDADFSQAGIFSSAEENQKYLSRSDWEGTYGKRIVLTATAALKSAQAVSDVQQDDIDYPVYNAGNFYESDTVFDEMKLIYLRGKAYDDPLWDDLLDCMSFEETATLLQEGLRLTLGVSSIAAPGTSQQNGAVAPVHARTSSDLPRQSGFTGFAEALDPQHKSQLPPVFCNNGIVASTFNVDLIERLGEQTGEEAAWAGFNGIYGLGVNIHRGAYCGRTFEYYSEDGFLTGISAGYEAVGMHKLGVFVLMKHAILNDQETQRAGINVWANEQSIREIYCRAIEVAVEIDREYTPRSVLGVMTGMNRIGATWTGGQGFCNTVLRAEFGMRGYVISDYNSQRFYMSPVQGVLYGNDLPDGTTKGWNGGTGTDYDGNNILFAKFAPGSGHNYGGLAWAMRDAAHNILYTVVNSNAMNGIDGDFSSTTITPAWEIAVPVLLRVSLVLFVWSTIAFVAVRVIEVLKEFAEKPEKVSEANAERDKENSD